MLCLVVTIVFIEATGMPGKGIGHFFGAMQISVTAFALEHGAAGIAAALFTVSSCASLLAGWRKPG